jgi:hypothetical protein
MALARWLKSPHRLNTRVNISGRAVKAPCGPVPIEGQAYEYPKNWQYLFARDLVECAAIPIIPQVEAFRCVGCGHKLKNRERHSKPFQEWTEVLGSERLTGALLDRLTHHVHILEMNGESYRLKQSKRKRGSPPNS